MSSSATTLLHANKKALFDYEIIESFEAGIVLTGAEVKSVRAWGINLKGSHVSLNSGRPMLLGAHVSPYKQVFGSLTSPVRDREIFLHKKTILFLASKVREKWITIIPTEVYLKGTLIKVRIALARGRATYDKRAVLKGRTLEREARKALQIRL